MLNQWQQGQGLSANQLQFFAAGLSGLPPEEVRKAKSLYIRNAISQYKAVYEGMKGFRRLQGCLMVIPFFWPVLYMQRRSMNMGLRLLEDQIINALEVWKDDLKGEQFDLDFLRSHMERDL